MTLRRSISILYQVLILVYLTSSALLAQDPAIELTKTRLLEVDNEIQLAITDVRTVLAGPNDLAFQQVLSSISIELNTQTDTSFSFSVYDIIVRYDPQRYRMPYAGLYPLTFEAQFIYWGKRLTLYSQSVPWYIGRFFLYNISNGRQAWMTLDDMGRLYPSPSSLPSPSKKATWLKYIYALEATTDLQTMGRWYSMMHQETQEELAHRLRSSLDEKTTPNTEGR